MSCGGAFSIENALELEEVLEMLLHSEEEYAKASEASRNYVYSQKGAKEKILDYIQQNNLLGTGA